MNISRLNSMQAYELGEAHARAGRAFPPEYDGWLTAVQHRYEAGRKAWIKRQAPPPIIRFWRRGLKTC